MDSTSGPNIKANSTFAETQEPEHQTRAMLFFEPHPDGNTFACAHCHAESAQADAGLLRAGHHLGNAALRPSFKNGQLHQLREAVNSCRVEWMAATAYAADTPDWLQLKSLLEDFAQTQQDTEPLTFEIVPPPPAEVLRSGNPDQGRTLFNRSCAICHGHDGAGNITGPKLQGSKLSAARVAERIRLSGNARSSVYEGLTGGRMPFFSRSRLSDNQLSDIVAFVTQSEPEELRQSNDGQSVDVSVADAQSNCSQTHPNVGKKARLSTLSHQVAGEAEIIDDCTIRISSFHFDGGGIDVRVYGGQAGHYEQGPQLSKDFLGMAFVEGTMEFRLPPGISLDDFDGISIWCVAVQISFGDGLFQ